MTLAEIRVALEEKGGNLCLGQAGDKAPKRVFWVPRLLDDILALKTLFAKETPPRCRIRSNIQAVVIYKFGDASGTGFGSSFYINNRVYYRHG